MEWRLEHLYKDARVHCTVLKQPTNPSAQDANPHHLHPPHPAHPGTTGNHARKNTHQTVKAVRTQPMTRKKPPTTPPSRTPPPTSSNNSRHARRSRATPRSTPWPVASGPNSVSDHARTTHPTARSHPPEGRRTRTTRQAGTNNWSTFHP